MNIKLYLVDNHDGFRQALRTLLELQPDMTVIGEAANGKDGLQQILQHAPDVALLDIFMPGLDGIAVTRQIRHQRPDVCVIILGMHPTEPYMQKAYEAGAQAYIPKESAALELVDAIRASQITLSSVSGFPHVYTQRFPLQSPFRK
ncbi:MAG: response regulator transcription factor [Caldilineaceae bacterium]